MLAILMSAALLEAGGDALVRFGLHAPTSRARLLFWLAGGLVLFAYGCLVNAPPLWDFGQLIGVYVVFFFVVAQLISWLAFHQAATRGVFVGGFFIIAGGLIIATGWR
jgi:hypothetical protein